MITLDVALREPIKTYLKTLKWEVYGHIAPSDDYVLRSMIQGLANQQFRSYEFF